MNLCRLGLVASLLGASVTACSRHPVTSPQGAGGSAGGGAGASGGVAGNATPGSGGAVGGNGGPGTGGALGGNGGPGTGGAAGSTVACVPLAPIPRRLWALQPAHYGNATRDLLSLGAAPSVPFAAPPVASTLAIDANYLYALYQTAGSIAAQVAPRAAALAACGAGETDAACATGFARSFGRKAFRRPLEDGEVAAVMKVFTTVCPGPSSASCASAADFAAAVNLMIKAFILAPSFLYRTELGPPGLTANAAGVYPDTTLTADEVATQLAFLLLGSTPDDGLIAAADSGALATPAGIASEVNRLLALPAAQANVTGMVAQWLRLDRLGQIAKDPTLLAPLTAADQDQPAIAAELRASWDRTVAQALWSNPPRRVTALLTSQTFFATPRLAVLYGLQPAATPNATFTEIAWPAAQGRAGILTHPAFLWSVSNVANVDIVNRGKAIHDAIVCADPVGVEPDPATPERIAVSQMGDSEATQSDARLASGNLCATNCHTELDTYGRSLHAFDAAGKYRTVDEAGRPIDTSAALTASSPLGPTTLSGPTALANALVSSNVFAGCAVQRLFEAALDGRVPTRNTCQVNDLRAAFDQSDGTMAALMRGIALSDYARARAGGTK